MCFTTHNWWHQYYFSIDFFPSLASLFCFDGLKMGASKTAEIYFSVLGRIVASKMSMPQSLDLVYYLLWQKGLCRSNLGYRYWNGGITLNYLGELCLITWIFENRKPFPAEVRKRYNYRRKFRVILHCWLWKWRKGTWTKQCRWPPKAGKGNKIESP